MMWTTTVLLLLVPHLLSSTDTGNRANFTESEIINEDFSGTPDKGEKLSRGVKGRDACSIPCDITVKLLRDEKHSICGQLQQSLLVFGRSTRKLIRDVMEEQQRALDILSSQVTELMTKVQTLSSEVQRSNAEMYSIKPVQSHGEHWLGLKKVFHIVNQKDTRFQLHIALVSHDDITSYASYDDFQLDTETQFFGIHLGRYAGSAGDAFRGYDQDQNQDTAPFSASDVDNDGCNPSCSISNRTVESCSAQHNHTGWWFNQCGLANLNGSPEDAEQNRGQRTHILWDTWRQNGVPHTIKSVTMKIRRIATNN